MYIYGSVQTYSQGNRTPSLVDFGDTKDAPLIHTVQYAQTTTLQRTFRGGVWWHWRVTLTSKTRCRQDLHCSCPVIVRAQREVTAQFYLAVTLFSGWCVCGAAGLEQHSASCVHGCTCKCTSRGGLLLSERVETCACVCVYVFMYISMCVYAYFYECICLCVCLCICLWVCLHVRAMNKTTDLA